MEVAPCSRREAQSEHPVRLRQASHWDHPVLRWSSHSTQAVLQHVFPFIAAACPGANAAHLHIPRSASLRVLSPYLHVWSTGLPRGDFLQKVNPAMLSVRSTLDGVRASRTRFSHSHLKAGRGLLGPRHPAAPHKDGMGQRPRTELSRAPGRQHVLAAVDLGGALSHLPRGRRAALLQLHR